MRGIIHLLVKTVLYLYVFIFCILGCGTNSAIRYDDIDTGCDQEMPNCDCEGFGSQCLSNGICFRCENRGHCDVHLNRFCINGRCRPGEEHKLLVKTRLVEPSFWLRNQPLSCNVHLFFYQLANAIRPSRA